jgi:hypothetical protein
MFIVVALWNGMFVHQVLCETLEVGCRNLQNAKSAFEEESQLHENIWIIFYLKGSLFGSKVIQVLVVYQHCTQETIICVCVKNCSNTQSCVLFRCSETLKKWKLMEIPWKKEVTFMDVASWSCTGSLVVAIREFLTKQNIPLVPHPAYWIYHQVSFSVLQIGKCPKGTEIS